MSKKIFDALFAVFSAVWMIIIFTEYWRYNPEYSKSLELFQYYDLLLLFTAVGAGLNWIIKKLKNKPSKLINGLSIFVMFLFLNTLAVNRFTTKEPGLSFTSEGIISQLGHFIGVSICLFLIYLFVKVLGSIFTNIFPINMPKRDHGLVNIAIGILIFSSMMFVLGACGLLVPYILIPITIVILGLYWRHTFQICRDTLWAPISIPQNLNIIGIISFLILSIFLVLNFGQILRPFPIGSDSLRLYVNAPTLIADYGGLISGFQPYNWSLFMSAGLVIFDRVDVVLAISFFGGLCSLLALYQLSRKWVDVNYSALILVLFYSIPIVSFLSYMDMKVDMALLFYTLISLLVFYHWMNPHNERQPSIDGIGLTKAKSYFQNKIPSLLKQNRHLVLIGLLSGFAVGIKLTFLFFFLALICSVWYFKGNKLTFIGSFFLCCAAIFILKLDAHPGLRQFHQHVGVLQWCLLAVGLSVLAFLFIKRKQKLTELMKYSMIIGAFFTLPLIPWLGKNLIETGQISVTSLLTGKEKTPKFKLKNYDEIVAKTEVIIPGLYQMPEETIKQKKEKSKTAEKNTTKRKKKSEEKKKIKNKNKNSSVSEDLHRFMGYETVPARYLSLPYDVFVKTNIQTFFVDVGILLWLLLPILFLFPGKNNSDRKSKLASILFVALSIITLVISIPSALLNRHQLANAAEGLAFLNSNPSVGQIGKISDYTNTIMLSAYAPLHKWMLATSNSLSSITYPMMIALFLLIIGIVYYRVRKHTRSTQSITLLVLMYFFLWWVLGCGASWYGLMLFCIPFIFIFKSISDDELDTEKKNKFDFAKKGLLKKAVIISASMVWILYAFTYRASNYTPVDKERANRIYFSPIMKYTMGEININRLMEYHFPSVQKITSIVNKDKRALVYMVGSPSKYFITKNDSRVLSDTYLDFFAHNVQYHKTKQDIIKRLKDEGFKYIIFDLKMISYDVTPEKTLTKKFIQFLNTLYANPQVELVTTDRRIQLNSTGEEVFSVFQDKGTITNFGNIALFRIK